MPKRRKEGKRVCKWKGGCTTPLSIYNPTPFCTVHERRTKIEAAQRAVEMGTQHDEGRIGRRMP